ncbi:DUF2497 domain-containing protein [Acetobacter sicerae]|nr:DUF2497 domain-containing protein [Acetobacter sicerae]
MTENNDPQQSENGSINTVLSSIRRILQEGKEAHAVSQQSTAPELQTPAQPEPKSEEAVAPPAPSPQDDDDSVLVLDSSMFAPEEETESHEHTEQEQPAAPVEAHAPVPLPAEPEQKAEQKPEPEPEPTPEPPAPVAEAPAEPEHVTAPPPSPAPEPEPVSAQPAETHESVTAETESHVPVPTLPTPVPVVPPLSPPEHLVENIETQQARTRMSENRTPAETAAGYSDSDAPQPVQIALDKQTVGATEHSFGALQQMLRRKQSFEHKERRVAITRGGNLTIEDIVRDEVRAFLKEWLDQHLSGIVQQAVQKEIERLSDR